VGLVSAMYCFMSGRMTGWAWCLLTTVYIREDDWVGLVPAVYCYMLGRMTGWAWCLLCTVIC
jgi:hypothetical protein